MDYNDELDRKEAKKLLLMSSLAGRIMLRNGAETYRVEDTIERICKSRKEIKYVDVFATPTGIFTSLEFKEDVLTYFTRVKSTSTNLRKINSVNDFSREFVNSDMTVDDGLAKLKKISKGKAYPPSTRRIFGGISCAGFSHLFGGIFIDSVASFIIGFLVILVIDKINQYKMTFFINNFIGSCLAGFMAILLTNLGLGNNIDTLIIASIMPLVPGVAITNAMRDMMSGDFVSGMSRAMEAIFSSIAIAFGVGLILNVFYKGGI